MGEGDGQGVLRCAQCNKPFDKQASLKRHGYYCRSRSGTNITRARSCIVCASNKTRCDNQRPSCSRCVAKGEKCAYPAKTMRKRAPVGRSEDAALPLKDACVAAPDVMNAVHGNMDDLESALTIQGEEFLNFGNALTDWDAIDIDFSTLDNLQSYEQPTYDYTLPLPPAMFRQSSTPQSMNAIPQRPISPADIWTPRPPTFNTRRLMLRQDLNKGKKRIANLLLRTLRSYPLMMLRHNRLPPFIHSQFASLGLEDTSLDALTNCIGLVRMISGEVRGSRKLFWSNVSRECERILAELANYNRWEILVAMQALSVYLLVRLNEGENEDNNVDTLVLSTLAAITQQVINIGWNCDVVYANCLYGGKMGWKDWVFEESRRRLSALFRIVGMIVHLDPTTLCELQSDLVIAPLPSKKELWEASSQASWRLEAQKEYKVPSVFGLAGDGELLEIRTGKTFCAEHFTGYDSTVSETGTGRTVADWEEWCLGMDGFGGLIMLAASLVG